MVVIRSAQGKLVGLSTMCIRSGYKARGRNRQPFTHRSEMREVSPRPVSRGRCRDAAAFCFVYGAESPRRAVRTEMEARREIYPQTKRKPSDTRCRGLWALSCSDFVEVNKMLTAEVLRPAGAARSKGLGCFPTRPLCINKDIACKALCVQKHCLQQSFFTRYARACVVSLNYPTTGVQPEFARVIVSTNSRLRWICGGKPPARAHGLWNKV